MLYWAEGTKNQNRARGCQLIEALDLPPSVLTKHVVDSLPTSSSGRKTNRLPYGVCKLTVRRSVGIIQHIYGAIQEYIGSDEPRWLD